MPASSWVWVLYTDSPKDYQSVALDISTKFQTDVHPVLTCPGSRWLRILTPSSFRPSNHTSDMSVRQPEEEGWKKWTEWSSLRSPVESGGISYTHRRSRKPSQHKSLPAFTTWIQFSKRWSCHPCCWKSFCCRSAWICNSLFQPLPQATSCTEFYYTDIMTRQFHNYPILSKGKAIMHQNVKKKKTKNLKNIFQTYSKNTNVRNLF